MPESTSGSELLDRQEREELLHLLNEETRRRHDNPLRYWRPHPKQARFLNSPKKIRIFCGGNQSGKTSAGVILGISHAYGYRIWEVPDLDLRPNAAGLLDLPARESVPRSAWLLNAKGQPLRVPNTGMVVTGLAARRGVGECIWPKLEDLWPPALKLSPRWAMGGVPASVVLPNGSKILFGSAEQTDLSTEAIVLDWAWYDEPIPQRIHTGIQRGLIRNFGPTWMTYTPLGTRGAWIHHDFIAPALRGDLDNVEYLEIFMRDNPHLDPAAIDEFERDPSMSEAERAARLYGKSQHLALRVVPQFLNTEPYVVEPHELPAEWPRLQCVDPHTARPWAMIWLAIDPMGKFWVYREWPEIDYSKIKSHDHSFQEYAGLIRNIEGKRAPTWRVMDPNFGVQRRASLKGMTERSIQEEMRAYGLHFDCRVDDGQARTVGLLNDLLTYDRKRPLSPDNYPKIIVFSSCTNTIAALLHASYIEPKGTNRKPEVISEEFKDFLDCLRYATAYERPSLTESYSYFEPTAGRDDQLIEDDF